MTLILVNRHARSGRTDLGTVIFAGVVGGPARRIARIRVLVGFALQQGVRGEIAGDRNNGDDSGRAGAGHQGMVPEQPRGR